MPDTFRTLGLSNNVRRQFYSHGDPTGNTLGGGQVCTAHPYMLQSARDSGVGYLLFYSERGHSTPRVHGS